MPRDMNIMYYPDDTYIIGNEDYGYNYVRVTFLDCADKLTDGGKGEIIRKFRNVLLEYFKTLDAEECENGMEAFEPCPSLLNSGYIDACQ